MLPEVTLHSCILGVYVNKKRINTVFNFIFNLLLCYNKCRGNHRIVLKPCILRKQLMYNWFETVVAEHTLIKQNCNAAFSNYNTEQKGTIMENNVQKFVDLLQEDASLQEKIQDAIKNYSGEQTLEAAFQAVLQPIIEEKECSFTVEDLQEYIKEKAASIEIMSKDELKQTAGGTGGLGATACYALGAGLGVHANQHPDDPTCVDEFGVCIVVGIGLGAGACAVPGASKKF